VKRTNLEENIIFLNFYCTDKCALFRRAIDFGAEIFVRSGSPILYTGGTVHRAIEILIHEDYNDLNNDYDIALVKITPPFTYNDHTKPVGLPSDDAEEISNKQGLVCGWGYYKVMAKYQNEM